MSTYEEAKQRIGVATGPHHDKPILIDVWTIEDANEAARNISIWLTDDELVEVLHRAEKTYDSDIGMNWSILEDCVRYIYENRGRLTPEG